MSLELPEPWTQPLGGQEIRDSKTEKGKQTKEGKKESWDDTQVSGPYHPRDQPTLWFGQKEQMFAAYLPTMHVTLLPTPHSQPSYKPISARRCSGYHAGFGIAMWPRPHSNFWYSFLLDLRPKLLAILPLICLSARRFIPHLSLFCIARTSFPSILCSLAYQCVWLMGGTGRRLVLGGAGKPEYLSPPLSLPQLVSSSVAAFLLCL